MSSQILNRSALPIDPFLTEISGALKSSAGVIILAEPGAGKSTRVPVSLMQSFPEGKWYMLQPRRWAAKLVAERIAEENKFSIGQEIGYQIRFENRTSSQSKLIVMTEGVLLRKLITDQELSGVQGVILDEFHERSLDLDLSLALLKELQESIRPDLKIVVMSATLDPQALQKFLPDTKLFQIPGRTFPVEKKFLGSISVARAVKQALDENGFQDGLVFLPGAYEIEAAIRDTAAQFPEILKKVDLLPLYSSLTEQEQKKVFQQRSRAAVIFSTNIAETSITLPKIKWVIDNGQAKVMRNDPQLGQDRLELLRISKASSEQRAGRAGRVSEGICYRLWSKEEDSQLRLFETPEVHRLNLSGSFLFLANYGVGEPEKFNWFEKPKSSATQFAKNELTELGFVLNGKITQEGKSAAAVPLPPLMAKLKIVGEKNQALDFAARLGAFLEEGKSGSSISDWDQLIRTLNQLSKRALQAAAQIAGKPVGSIAVYDQEVFENVLTEALKARVFIQGKKVGRRMIKGEKSLHLPDYGLVLNSFERDEQGKPVVVVRDFVPIKLSTLEKFSKKKRVTEWDEGSSRVRAREGFFFEDLALKSETEVSVTPQDAEAVLCDLILKNPEGYFLSDESFREWKMRLDLWNKYSGQSIEIPWNEIIPAACIGKTKLNQVLEFPWRSYLESTIPELHQMDADLPEKIEVPSGSKIKIDYQSDPPKLSVRLQEIFGWLETPKLMNGKTSLLIELLSPGFKPIQLTRDLKSFWGNAYFEVKKELKARYPKHAWPENPLTAKPEAKGRRRF